MRQRQAKTDRETRFNSKTGGETGSARGAPAVFRALSENIEHTEKLQTLEWQNYSTRAQQQHGKPISATRRARFDVEGAHPGTAP